MFLNQFLKQYNTKLSTKLTLIYGFGVILSTFIIFTFVYFQIIDVFRTRDRERILTFAKDISQRAEIRGTEDLTEFLAAEFEAHRDGGFLVAILDSENRMKVKVEPSSLYTVSPEQIEYFLLLPAKTPFEFRFQMVNHLERATGLVWPLQSGERIFVAQVSDLKHEYIQRIESTFWLSLILVVLIGFVGGFFVASRTLSPLRDLVRSFQEAQDGVFNQRLAILNTNDEVDELKILFNKMLERVQDSIQGLKQAFDHLAHDIRTPVTRLRGRAELALNEEGSAETYREALESCYENSDRIIKFLDVLTRISEANNRSINLKKQVKSLSECAKEILDLYEIAFEEKNIKVRTEFESDDLVDVDVNLIKRVIANLLDNAVKYTPEGGEILVTTWRSGLNFSLSIIDSGPGVSMAEQDLVWKHLFRGDLSRSEYGMGLGLTFVKAVVEAHGGHVKLISPIEKGRGSEFRISFRKSEFRS